MLYLYIEIGLAYVVIEILLSSEARKAIIKSEPLDVIVVLFLAVVLWPLCLIHDISVWLEK